MNVLNSLSLPPPPRGIGYEKTSIVRGRADRYQCPARLR